MSKLQFEVLRLLEENKSIDKIAYELFENENEINNVIDFLKTNKYIDNDLKVSNVGYKELDKYKVDNAIILAAGMSTRFVPICFEKPKGLLPIKGQSLIERQIIQLREKDIDEIIVVVGYQKEQFEFLKERYNVILVESTEYETRNNHSSVYAAKKYLKNSIITNSDLYFTENIFQKYAYDSYYTTLYMDGPTPERGTTLDDNGKIIETFYGEKAHDVWVTLGYAFFSKKFSNKMIEILDQIYDEPSTYNKFWADIQDEHLKELYMYAKKVHDDVIYEFDYLHELRDFDETYKTKSNCKTLEIISKLLNTTEDKLDNFYSLRNISSYLFKFDFNDQTYLCNLGDSINDTINYDNNIYKLINKEREVHIYEKRS